MPSARISDDEADEMKAKDSEMAYYLILMSHFKQHHNAEWQDIRTYIGVGIEYEGLCREKRETSHYKIVG